MDVQADPSSEEPVTNIFKRLLDNGRTYARAEVELYKGIARYRVGKASSGITKLIIGGVLLWFAVSALLLGIVLALATLIGPLAAGVAVAVLLGGAGYYMIRSGLPGLAALSGDEDEAEAVSLAGRHQ
jgi:hypothetical protein